MAASEFSRRKLLIVAGLGAVFGPGTASAIGQVQQSDATFSTDVNVVNVLATVRDKAGRIVTDLTKDDFVLTENDRPRTLRYFSRETDLPLTLGFLIDTSMSQRGVLADEKTASLRFVENVLREDKDTAFLIQFDFDVQLIQDLTSSRAALGNALNRVDLVRQERPSFDRRGRSSGQRGGTTLYDSVLLAAEDVLSHQEGRKALVVLSDGVDTGSKVSLDRAIMAALKANTLVYSILFKGEAGSQSPFARLGGRGRGGPPAWIPESNGKKVLQKLSGETGGGFFEVSKKQSIEDIYRQIETELRNQYSLGFSPTPSETGEGFRRIGITVKRPNLTVQTSQGYYQRR